MNHSGRTPTELVPQWNFVIPHLKNQLIPHPDIPIINFYYNRKLGTLFETLFRTNFFKNIERDTIYENRVSQSQVTSKLY